MFDSVLGRPLGAPARPGLGAAVSLGLHLLVLAVALQLSHPSAVAGPPFVPVHFPRGPGAGTLGARPKAAAPAPTPRGPALRPRTAAARAAASPEEVASAPAAPAPEGSPGLAAAPGAPETPCTTAPCADALSQPPPGSLSSDMQPPQLLSGPEPRYPLAAALEHVGGSLLVRCTVTAEGRVRDCVVLKSLPYLEEPVLAALSARRYRPALQDGRPVAVRMVFPVRVLPP